MLVLDKKESCTGCGACYNICPKQCIAMAEDKEGFLYPNIDIQKCIHCNMCKSVCPVENGHNEELDASPEAYLTYAKDEQLREEATSGGLFSGIALNILTQGGVVYGATYGRENIVHHIRIDMVDQLNQLNRSKYVQSDTRETYKDVMEDLNRNCTVLYSGTACQVYGLVSYLKKKRVNTENLFTMDVICHGTPSPKLLREYLKWQASKGEGPVLTVAMRGKCHPKKFYSEPITTVRYTNGQEHKESAGTDLYGRFFLGEISSRPSCYSCVFKTIGRASDLTIGDCWFSKALTGKKDIPFDVTLCLVQTDKGKNLLMHSDNISIIRVDPEKAIRCNGGMLYSSAVPHIKREEFFSRLGNEPLNILAEDYFPIKEKKNGIVQKGKDLIKQIPGVYRYYYFKKRKEEFERRCKREVPQNAYSKRTI